MFKGFPKQLSVYIYNDDDRQYLQMMQENIARMAGNSSNCKTWLITLVCALITLAVTIQSLNNWIWFSVFPILMLWQLDAYYLKLERGLRNRERDFVNIVSATVLNEELYKASLFNFKTLEAAEEDKEKGIVSTRNVEWSDSVFTFYAVVFGIATIASLIVMFTL